MKLSKKDRRIVRRCVDEAQTHLDEMQTDWGMGSKQVHTLELIYTLLTRIGARLEGKKHGRR